MRRLAALAVCCALLAGAASHAVGARDATRQARPSRASADPAGRPNECDRHPPSFVSGNDAHTLKCFHLPDRLVPAKSDAAAWSLGGGRFLVAWRSDEKVSGLRIWRRADASWTRLFNQDKSPPVDYGVSLDDITGDGRTDVLANESNGGSGGCGNRFAFGVDTDRVDPLFRRYVCETDAELHDGLLWFREPI